MKHVVLIFILLFSSFTFFGQTLVRYGNHSISRDEFLTAYRKNNSKIKATDKTYREYLDLYIRYRLKVQAALDRKLDTLPGQVTELQNFKSQIADQYTNDENSLNQMADEAFARSHQDLRISYIFVSVPKEASPADTAKAWKKIQEAYQALESNKDFDETALLYSEDPFVKNNKGDIGFITVFDLPYAMENVAYSMNRKKGMNQHAANSYSPVFRIDGGYVILKKTAERPALGRIRIAQILVMFPYQADEAAKVSTRKHADSIYEAIQSGADFGALAKKFSGDNLSYQTGGILPEFGIGKYEAGFEQTAFALKKDGEVSAPYESAFGYHIIKRISRIPVPPIETEKIRNELKEKIKQEPRAAVSRKYMLQTILKQTGYKEFIPAGNIFWEYTDSSLMNKKLPGGITNQSLLFQLADKKYTVGDWIVYRKSIRSVPALTTRKKNAELLDVYRQNIAFQYYKDNLEKYNPAYAAQVYDFRDGNLLFEIMQQEIWNKAAADSGGLKKYFEANAKKYWWQPGAEAIIFNAANPAEAVKMQADFEKNRGGWRTVGDRFSGQVQADSGRFELKQIPGGTHMEAGHFTELETNTDKTVRFAYIIREYPAPAPRTYEEARGLVINDYQNELENQWIAELKKKYPVTVNEVLFKALPR